MNIGVVSRRDLIKWMARSDAALTLDVIGVLSDQARRLAHLEVRVHEGVAHIEAEAAPDTLTLAANWPKQCLVVMDARVIAEE